MDDIDVKILSLLVEDGRRTYGDIGEHVVAVAPRGQAPGRPAADQTACSRASPPWSTTRRMGAATEALVELFYAPGTLLDEVTRRLERHPEVVEAWSVTGEADAIARVRTLDNADLERLIMELQRDGLVERTRSQIVMSQLLGPPEA